MDNHLHTRHWCFKFMADSGDHVAFELIDKSELRHVRQHDSSAKRVFVNPSNRNYSGKIKPFLTVITEAKRVFQGSRQVIGTTGEHFAERLLDLSGGRPGNCGV